MTLAEITQHLTVWQARCLVVDAQWDALSASTGAAVDSPLGSAVWMLVDAYTDAVARLLNVPDSGRPEFKHDLSWYAYENDFGRRGSAAGTTGDMRTIKTPADLAWLITLSQDVPDATP